MQPSFGQVRGRFFATSGSKFCVLWHSSGPPHRLLVPGQFALPGASIGCLVRSVAGQQRPKASFMLRLAMHRIDKATLCRHSQVIEYYEFNSCLCIVLLGKELKSIRELVCPEGIEPPTHSLEDRKISSWNPHGI